MDYYHFFLCKFFQNSKLSSPMPKDFSSRKKTNIGQLNWSYFAFFVTCEFCVDIVVSCELWCLKFHWWKLIACMKLSGWLSSVSRWFKLERILQGMKSLLLKISVVLSTNSAFFLRKKPSSKIFKDDFMANCFIYEIFFTAFH